MVLSDVTPLSLGVETRGDTMYIVIPRNTSIPTKKDCILVTSADSQTAVPISVYQGERARSKDNNLLGNLLLDGLPPAPNQPVSICFEIDVNGILTVSAEHKNTGKKNEIAIGNNEHSRSKVEIDGMLQDAEKYRLEDQSSSGKCRPGMLWRTTPVT